MALGVGRHPSGQTYRDAMHHRAAQSPPLWRSPGLAFLVVVGIFVLLLLGMYTIRN